jgi:hypothetical protein
LSKTITNQEWEDTYKPIKNPTNDWGGNYSAFETFTPDVTFVSEQPDNTIWTELDGDNGVYIVSGYHLVNRIQYYVTEVPWTEDVEIVVCEYIDCDCYDGEVDPKNNCPECGGTGTKTVWAD